MIIENLPDATDVIELLHQLKETPAQSPLRKINKPLALYGAGELGKLAKNYFDYLNIPVDYVVDTYAEKFHKDEFWKGVPILSPKEISKKQHEETLIAVCIVKVSFSELKSLLQQQGWQDIVPLYDICDSYRHKHPLSNGWSLNKFSNSDISNISSVLLNWQDDISRAHHLQFIAWHYLRQDWIFKKAAVNTDNRFFIPEIVDVLTHNESFLDVGAYHGLVSRQFMKVVKNKFKHIWMVEPDPINLVQLNQEYSSETQSNIDLITSVISSNKRSEKFCTGLGYASQLSTLGSDEVQTTTIDQLETTPSLIKLHLEGHELSALKGAIQTININRSIIMATSYHNSEGLWALPEWLMRNLSNYKMYLRLHAWCGTGSVIYAIPEERNNLKN